MQEVVDGKMSSKGYHIADLPCRQEVLETIATGGWTAASWLRATLPERPPVVEGLAWRGALTVIAGDSGVGKSAFLTQLAACVASGVPFCGLRTEAGVAVVLGVEDPAELVQRRIRLLVEDGFLDPPSLPHLILPAKEYLADLPRFSGGSSSDWADDLLQFVSRITGHERLALLVLDPLRLLHSADENKANEMASVMYGLAQLAERLDCALLVSHHTRKNTESDGRRRKLEDIRGSSVLIAESRVAGMLSLLSSGDSFYRYNLTTKSNLSKPMDIEIIADVGENCPPHNFRIPSISDLDALAFDEEPWAHKFAEQVDELVRQLQEPMPLPKFRERLSELTGLSDSTLKSGKYWPVMVGVLESYHILERIDKRRLVVHPLTDFPPSKLEDDSLVGRSFRHRPT